MEKCEYLTGKELGYTPGVVEQAKFEYSRLSFNKGVQLNDKKSGL